MLLAVARIQKFSESKFDGLNSYTLIYWRHFIYSYLEKTVEKDSKIRDQDKFRAVHSVIMQGNEGVMIALEFMENRLPDMIKQ